MLSLMFTSIQTLPASHSPSHELGVVGGPFGPGILGEGVGDSAEGAVGSSSAIQPRHSGRVDLFPGF